MSPHIEVTLTFTSTKDGGRQFPVQSGFRVPHDFYGGTTLHDAVHTYIGKSQINPGESAQAHLTLLAPEQHAQRMYVGQYFTVRQGHAEIAHGTIVRIIDPTLRASPGCQL